MNTEHTANDFTVDPDAYCKEHGTPRATCDASHPAPPVRPAGHPSTWTRQDLFSYVVGHLRAQGRKALNANSGMCAYRAPDGAKCAGGCLITDEEYMPEMEGKLFSGLYLAREYEGTGLINLIERLQMLHDNDRYAIWESEFAKLAAKFGLVVPAVSK